jgi:hypothetical protein
MKKIGIGATTIIIITLFASLIGTANATIYTPGVKVGDVFKYQYNLSMNLDTQQLMLPTIFEAIMEQAKSIDWIQMTVTNVTSSKIDVQMLTQFKNQTQQTYNGTVDVSAGLGELNQFLIAANLAVDSPLYTGSQEKINGTTTRTYSSGSRELNYETISMEYNVTQEELTQFNITGPLKETNTQNVYWDKQTGSLVEMTYHMATEAPTFNSDITVNITLIESNVFTVPEYPALLIVLLVLIVPAFVAIKFRKNSLK